MNPDEKTAIDSFFEDLPETDKTPIDIFAEEKPAAVETPPETPEEGDGRKNRRHRRLEAQLNQEREARIAAEARAEALSETQQFRESSQDSDVPSKWLTIYGDTPQSRDAWKMQKEVLAEEAAKFKEETLNEIRQESVRATQEQQQFESFIDKELESIEDSYNVDLTSNAPAARKARKELLEAVERFSPKDEFGNVKDYADFDGVFQNMHTAPQPSRNKELASRSMTRSQGSVPQKGPEPSYGWHAWKKDYNL